MAGALLGSTAADVAIADALTGQGMGQIGTAQSYRCQRTQSDDQINRYEQLGCEKASCCALEFLHRITNFWRLLSLRPATRQHERHYAQLIIKQHFFNWRQN